MSHIATLPVELSTAAPSARRDGPRPRLWVTPGICQQGLVFVGHGVELVLSHEQLQVMAMLKGAINGWAQYEVKWYYFNRLQGWQRKEPLSGSQRASLSRTIRRLEQKGMLTKAPHLHSDGKSPYTCLELTAEGLRLIKWLTEEWDGWKVYEKHFGHLWSPYAIEDAHKR